MTYEQMKFRLGDYLRCKKFYERHMRELKLIESKLDAAGLSIDYAKPKIKTSAAGNAAYADWITHAMFLKKELENEVLEVQHAKEAVSDLIDTVQDRDKKDVLRYKYLVDWITWREIGKVMNISPERARHICYEAIKELAEK